MSRFAWSPELALGVPLIDAQHRSLVERTATLLDCLQEGSGAEAAVQALAYLCDYVVVHFEAEERLMEVAGYPQLQAHRAEHLDFRRRVQALRDRFQLIGPGAEFAELVRLEICDWLVRHVQGSDAAIGRHLRLGVG